jgi:cystathionine beta-lyase/cystathionine gamma-synthase
MAAETTALMLFAPGDEILVQSDLYGGTYRLLTSVFAPRGIRPRFVDLRDPVATAEAITSCTRGIWIESPTNPLMNLVDLGETAAIARANSLITICDNTFLSPYFQRPLEFGIDIVAHSTTKYINGHSDVVGGALIVSRADLAERIAYLQNALGACAAPQDCFLVLRGIRRLHSEWKSIIGMPLRLRAGWSGIRRWRACCIRAWSRTLNTISDGTK